MRLHRLEIKAFGPFADAVSVDFDALSGAGLFLLTGATGSGKTSVLDAVCFALYGDVPGDRSTAKRLRSDHSAVDVAPEVVLEATLSARRIRITRSPAWVRPKRRGSGTTTQQARVTVAERVDGTWRTLTTRLDDTGHLVGSLVGLTLDQFCQVAMLPQGRFQAFLRARSEDRHRLLQQLFRTGRFEAVEQWLREHRLTLRRISDRHAAAVAGLVHRISEGAGVATVDSDPAIAETWSRDLLGRAAEAADTARAARDRAEARADRDATALADARTLAERQARYSVARDQLGRLEEQEKAHLASTRVLAAHGRAQPVLPVADLAATAEHRAAQHEAAVRGQDPDEAELRRTRDEAREWAAAARALQPRAEELVRVRAGLAAYATRIASLDQEIDGHERVLGLLPARLATARTDHAAARAAAAGLPALEAASLLTTLRPELAAAQLDLASAVDGAQSAKDALLDLRERRLLGMAAEIAGALVVGGCCPVCGSADHPQPARSSPGAPDAATEREARRRLDDAEAARLARHEHVRDLSTRIALTEHQAGPDGVALAAHPDRAQAALATAQRLAASEEEVGERLCVLEEEEADHRQRLDSARLERAGVASAYDAKRADEVGIAAQLRAGLGDDPDLAARIARLDDLAATCDRTLTALDEARRARAEADRCRAALAGALDEAGFPDVVAARAATLPVAEAERLVAEIRAHQEALAAARAVLGDPTLIDADTRPPPDLVALAAADATARAGLATAAAEARVALDRHERLVRLDGDLTTALAAWAPVRAALETATALGALVDGTSPDNRLQMRLSAYVLAYRLGQVVAAANQRLASMSDQRYSLAHTGRRGVGENRGGLSLLVRDDWSGTHRDPATLSGGETFVVSLALALGLADVITQESDGDAGGDSRLDTLFVDEGFGSLDADTLDDVMDTLDSLREGGRVVGVVSHVAEMRDRIPVRLEVTKSRLGSTVRATPGP